MSKYDFNINQRYAVYKVFKGICPWCKEPVEFKASHIDHVLPEELENDPERKRQVLDSFGLSHDFNINDYENWVPMHSYCNLEKNKKVYKGVGFIKTILDKCEKNKKTAQMIQLKMDREPEKAKILIEVQAAIERSLLNIYELQNFILNPEIMDSDDEGLKEIRKKIEGKIEYQAGRVISNIMNTIRSNTLSVIDAII